MRDVAHPAGDLTNESLRLIAYGSAAVENSGDSGDRHLCFAGYVFDRDHAPRGWADIENVNDYIEGASVFCYLWRVPIRKAVLVLTGLMALATAGCRESAAAFGPSLPLARQNAEEFFYSVGSRFTAI